MFSCVDDGAFFFNRKSEIIAGVKITFQLMEKWGLIVYFNDSKKSKTKIMHFPFTIKLKQWRSGCLALTNNDEVRRKTQAIVLSKHKVNLEMDHVDAPETEQSAEYEKRRSLEFTKQFACLGSALVHLMDDATDVWMRAIKATKDLDCLKSSWEAREVSLVSKTKSHEAIPINLLMWGSEN